MMETAVKAAELAKKKAELVRKIEGSKRELDSLNKILETETRRNFSTVATRSKIDRVAKDIELYTRQLNYLK